MPEPFFTWFFREMVMRPLNIAVSFLLASGYLLATPAAQTTPQPAVTTPEWPGWGGPRRDFTCDAAELAASWPPDGPKQIWSRPLGEGHSSIIVDGGRLYTMYRPPTGVKNRWNAEEVVVALDAASGSTIWEHRYPSSLETMNFSRGSGPHSTPLIVGDRLFAASTDKQFFALDKRTGKVLWSHNFVQEYQAPPNQMRWAVQPGYAPSPIAHDDNIIAMVGGPGQGVMAFRQDDGRVVWRSGEFTDIVPASPLLVTLDGEEQLIVTSGDGAHGFDPHDGRPLWSHGFPTKSGVNITTPIWSPEDRLLFLTAAYDGGARVLQLGRSGSRTEVTELWFSNQMRVHFGNVLRLGDYYYGSSGDFGAAFLTAVNARTGEIAWRDRTFAKASFLNVQGKVILLDEDGMLALVTLSGDGLNVLAKAQIARAISWTVPTLVKTTLYVRDRVNIMALDVGTK